MQYQSLIHVVSLLLSAIVALLAAQFSWQLYGYLNPSKSSSATLTPAALALPTPLPVSKGYSLTSLVSQPIFGQEVKQPHATQGGMPVSKAPLRLLGIIDGNPGVAVIHHGKTQRAYFVGEYIALPGRKIKIEQISSREVKISRDGAVERLVLKEKR